MSATSKFEARVTPEFKAELLLASKLEGTSITEFVTRHLEPCVKETLQRELIEKLNAEDSQNFTQALFGDKPRKLPYLKRAQTELGESGISDS